MELNIISALHDVLHKNLIKARIHCIAFVYPSTFPDAFSVLLLVCFINLACNPNTAHIIHPYNPFKIHQLLSQFNTEDQVIRTATSYLPSVTTFTEPLLLRDKRSEYISIYINRAKFILQGLDYTNHKTLQCNTQANLIFRQMPK